MISLADENGSYGNREAQVDQITLAGMMLDSKNHDDLELLHTLLTTSTSKLNMFLTWLEKDSTLWDADKLAFRDMLQDINDHYAESKNHSGNPVIKRLTEDRLALDTIFTLYKKETDIVFGKFRTRGMLIKRQAWDSYVKFVREKYPFESVLYNYSDDLPYVTPPSRGKKRNCKVDPLETFGCELPDSTFVLTFDDGPHYKRTPAVVNTLRKYQVPGIFFQVGQNLAYIRKDNSLLLTKAASVDSMVQPELFLTGGHTYTHALMPKLDSAGLVKEVADGERSLKAAGQKETNLFRPPYGGVNEKVMQYLGSLGKKVMMWNIDSRDWADPVPQSVANRVIAEAEQKQRGIILFHDIKSSTVDALPLVIETLQSRGFKFAGWNEDSLQTAPRGKSTVAIAKSDSVSMYQESHALVIGINDYQKWPKLSYAVNDALGVRDALVNDLKFKPENVVVLTDTSATRDRIIAELSETLGNPKRVSENDRLFVFFAGHGATRKLPTGRSLGYIIPVDADTKNYEGQAISMSTLQDINEMIPAKHVYFVMDACYSGLALTRGVSGDGNSSRYIKEVTARRARQILTAGGSDEEVSDGGPNGHSIFTWTLLQGLAGNADLNSDGFITASELGAFVAPSVSTLSKQTPAFGNLVGSGGGEFIFKTSYRDEMLSSLSEHIDTKKDDINAEIERVTQTLKVRQEENARLAADLAIAKAQLTANAIKRGNLKPLQDSIEALRQNELGVKLYKEKKHAQALTALLKAVALNPNNVQYVNNIGFLYHRMGDPDEAQLWLQRSLQIDSSRGVTYLNLADVQMELKHYAEAIINYKSYLIKMPRTPLKDSVENKIRIAEKTIAK
jgi:peptidoglycan/xylan/chitin deacetylase (PgdA/CDA1 family)